MPLAEPPVAAGSLSDLPHVPIQGRTLHRVWRYEGADGVLREQPWWFASAPDDRDEGGRYDLPTPMGTCYTAATPAGAVLEALQMHLTNLPRDELLARRRAEIAAPSGVPAAADLAAPLLAGEHGITAELWAGRNRPLTRRWAAALRRDGWWILHGGVSHDPSGRLRGFALFDQAGAHPPTIDGEWTFETFTLHDDADLHTELAEYGVAVRDPGDLPYAAPPE